MGCCWIVLLVVFALVPLSLQEKVTMSVEGVTTIAKTDDNFVCATLDWWPTNKCDYGMCPWGNASILNLDLENPILHNAIKAFKSMRIRLGGSLQDQVVYKVGQNPPECRNFKKVDNGLFGFSEGCLNMGRWKKLNEFFNSTGAVITFGLNALAGRHKASSDAKDTLYIGNWDPINAHDFINHTVSKGYKIDSWELGNELSAGGVSAKVDPKQYGKDVTALREIVNDVYKNSESQPKILAPGGFFDAKWFADMLQTTGPSVLHTVTHHIYNLGPGVDPNLIYKMQDPYFLSKVAQTFKEVQDTLKRFGPWASAWIGESGGAYNSGGKVSHTFVDSFWYLDQLGMASTFDHKVYCRQALIGGNYALLNTTTFIPNPDYYSALLWQKLMGPDVLQTTHDSSPYLRAYTHCSKDREQGKSAVTMLLINLSNSTGFDVSVANDLNFYPSQLSRYAKMFTTDQGDREVYLLTPKGGDIRSDVMLLNGKPLKVSSKGDIPDLHPAILKASESLHLAPQSIAFIKFKDFKAPACSSD